MLIPKIFKPYKEKITAGFIGYPENFAENEKTKNFLQKKFPETEKIFIPYQTHTKKIFSSEDFSEQIRSDGIWTTKKNQICTVKTADCIGGIFYNPKKNTIATIHAGWKGLAQKIFTEFLKNFPPQERKNFLVALSPCLQKCCAEFSDPYNETPKFFHPFISVKQREKEKSQKKFFIDLPQIAKTELMGMGIVEKNIEMPIFCTKCSVHPKWWSHRNSEIQRNLSFILLRFNH